MFVSNILKRWRNTTTELQPYALIYFEALYAEYQVLATEKVTDEVRTVAGQLLQKKDDHSLCWRDIYYFDLLLTRLMPEGRLRRCIWSLRARYKEVAGQREFENYLSSKPPDAATGAEPELRNDAEFLLRQMHLRYAMAPLRSDIREWISKLAAGCILGALFFLVASTFVTLLAPASTNPFRPPALLVVLFSGMLGGFVSVQQRFQSFTNEGDPIYNISELIHGRSSIYLAPVSGAVFAMVLFLMFLGGLLGGSLFPMFPSVLNTQDSINVPSFMSVFTDAAPQGLIDYAKLIVWSFLAGFAERLVPDALSRVVQKAQQAEASGTS